MFLKTQCFILFWLLSGGRAYVSTLPATALRCRGCRHRAGAPGSPLCPSACRSKGVPGPVPQWASRLHPEPVSSQAGQWLQQKGQHWILGVCDIIDTAIYRSRPSIEIPKTSTKTYANRIQPPSIIFLLNWIKEKKNAPETLYGRS